MRLEKRGIKMSYCNIGKFNDVLDLDRRFGDVLAILLFCNPKKTMYRVVQLCVILCCLGKLTLASLSCIGETPVSICTDDRRQGGHVYVNFSLVPIYDNNVSCSCYIFAQSDTEIFTTYETSSASDIILVNTSIRLEDQTFLEATKSYIKLFANSFKKLHFNGDIGKAPPGVCLKFNNPKQIHIEVVCLPNNNTTVPISGFSTTTNITTKTTFEATTQPISKTSDTTTESTSSITEQSTPSSTEQSSSSTAEVSQHERQPRRINYIVIGGAAGGGFLVVAIVVVVVVIMCRRRRLSVSQNKEQNINMSVNQTEEHTYNVENELYVSADDDILASGNHAYDVTHLQRFDVNHDKAKTTHDVTNNLSDSDNTYNQPDQYNPKQNVEKMNRCSNEYSVVFKNKNNTPSVDDTDTYDHVNRV